MTDWMYVQENAAEQLAQLHYFSFLKHQQGGDILFKIIIKEFAGQAGQPEHRAVRPLWLGEHPFQRLGRLRPADSPVPLRRERAPGCNLMHQ
jgi:hypothetical protein